MRLTRNLALALCWVLLSFSYSGLSNSQDLTGNVVYTTVNPPPPEVQFTWGGFINNNTGGGGTSGGNMPAYNSKTGTFIFGYNQGTVAYSLAVNSALANSGSGLQVSGFNYSWQYYNQDFSRGTLSGTIGLTNNTGKVLESYNYTMPKTTTGWTTMSGSQSFTSDYSLASLGNLTVSFTGKDDRYWAGYYGPQIRDIDVRLRYTAAADPCATNPSQNPSCPEYFQKYITPTSSPTVSIESISPSTTSQTSSVSSPTSSTTSSPTITETLVAAATPSSSNSSTPTSSLASTTNTTTSPSASNTQPRVGEVAVAGGSGQSSNQSSMSVGQLLSIVRAEQNRVSRLESNTVATAVEQATRDAEKVVNEAQSVAATQQASVISNNDANTSNLIASTAPSLGSGLQVNNNIMQQSLSIIRDPLTPSQSISVTVPVGPIANVVSNQTTDISNNNRSILPQNFSLTVPQSETTNMNFTRKEEIQEMVNQQSQESNSSLVSFNPTNPLNNYLNPPPTPSEAQAGPVGSVVNRNVQPNEASGGRDISIIATAPPGFDAYQSGRIPDGAFYASRDIYRNVTLPDNQRTQRALNQRSDNLHREMIEQQYRGRTQ